MKFGGPSLTCHSGSAWAFEAAPGLPKAQINTFDVSFNQLPPRDSVPRDVETDYLEILEGGPQHLHGQYDIARYRMLALVVKTGDPTTMFRNLLLLLSKLADSADSLCVSRLDRISWQDLTC